MITAPKHGAFPPSSSESGYRRPMGRLSRVAVAAGLAAALVWGAPSFAFAEEALATSSADELLLVASVSENAQLESQTAEIDRLPLASSEDELGIEAPQGSDVAAAQGGLASEPGVAISALAQDGQATPVLVAAATDAPEEPVLLAAAESESASSSDPQSEPETPDLIAAAEPVTYSNMYRLYNPNSGEHFYTASLYEARFVAEAGWRWEGVGWVAPDVGEEVFRLYNPNAGDHHYTLSAVERDWLVSLGWRYEGVGWRSAGSGEGVAMLRQYNPNAQAGAHNFTRSVDEDASLAAAGWSQEGIAWYASSVADQTIEGFWLDTSAWGSRERYWMASNAQIAHDRLISEEESGQWSYAKSDGAVVRGKWSDDDGHVYVGDSEGKLLGSTLSSSGWVVTDVYDGGLQRYWVDAALKAVRTGLFEVDGASYFGDPIQGYVLRNTSLAYEGQTYAADNDGKLKIVNAQTMLEDFAAEMLRIADDDSHGYDQEFRLGEYGDYDCSSLVIHSLNVAGFDTGEASWTGNMRSNLTERGWREVDTKEVKDLRLGDVLLADAYHTAAIARRDGVLVEVAAHQNEFGDIEGGTPGDQTGNEINTMSLARYTTGGGTRTPWWSIVLRYAE